jgi:hypothetical protein
MPILGQKPFTAGNKTRYEIDYSDWLDDGVTLTTVTIVMDPKFTATVTDIVISGITVQLGHKAVFFLQGGSVNETFTLDVQATDSRTEIKNDTVGFTVVAP